MKYLKTYENIILKNDLEDFFINIRDEELNTTYETENYNTYNIDTIDIYGKYNFNLFKIDNIRNDIIHIIHYMKINNHNLISIEYTMDTYVNYSLWRKSSGIEFDKILLNNLMCYELKKIRLKFVYHNI